MAPQAHEILAYIEIVIYSLILFLAIINVYHHGFRPHSGWVIIVAFSLLRISGGALLAFMTKSAAAAIGIQVATQTIYQIALGPLLAINLSFLNRSVNTNPKSDGRRTPLLKNVPRLLSFIHILILAWLILGIVGAVNRIPNSSTGNVKPKDYDDGAELLKLSSIVFLVALAGILLGLKYYWPLRSKMREPNHTLLFVNVSVIPLLALRVAYSLLSSFNLDTTKSFGHSRAFNTLTGSWVAYLLLAMLPQIGVIILYSIAGIVGFRRQWVKNESGVEIRLQNRDLE